MVWKHTKYECTWYPAHGNEQSRIFGTSRDSTLLAHQCLVLVWLYVYLDGFAEHKTGPGWNTSSVITSVMQLIINILIVPLKSQANGRGCWTVCIPAFSTRVNMDSFVRYSQQLHQYKRRVSPRGKILPIKNVSHTCAYPEQTTSRNKILYNQWYPYTYAISAVSSYCQYYCCSGLSTRVAIKTKTKKYWYTKTNYYNSLPPSRSQH